MIAPLVELDFFVEREKFTINASAQETIFSEFLKLFLKLALAPTYHWREDHHTFAFRQRQHVLHDLLDALPRNLRAADLAVRLSD